MSKNFLKKFDDVREDERGAESSEVILVLVLLVIGLLGAWRFLKGRIEERANCAGSTIQNANSAFSC